MVETIASPGIETGPDTPVRLTSFGDDFRAAVIGASGGIGGGFLRALVDAPATDRVFALSRSGKAPAEAPTVTPLRLDIEDETSIAAAAAGIREAVGSLHLVVVATGILHRGPDLKPEKTWRHLDADALTRVFRVNTVGPALVAKHFLPLLARDRKAALATLSARVGSISDNRLGGWHSYRASKAALNMLIKTFAIELARVNPSALCIGLHPGTVDSALSDPFQANVPTGKLFSADYSARSLLNVIDTLTPQHSGLLFAWDGQPIPF